MGRADGVGSVFVQPPRAMPRSNKQDRYAYAAAFHPRVNGETFTCGKLSRKMFELYPESGTPAHNLRKGRKERERMDRAETND